MNQTDTRKETLEFNKLQKRLRRHVGNAITDYNMIEDGDVVMACISGGKDSFAMLDILLNLQKAAPIKFEVIAVNLDQKQPGFPEHILPDYFETLNIPYYIVGKRKSTRGQNNLWSVFTTSSRHTLFICRKNWCNQTSTWSSHG